MSFSLPTAIRTAIKPTQLTLFSIVLTALGNASAQEALPATTASDNLATFYADTSILHVPSIDVGGTQFWADVFLRPDGRLEVQRSGPNYQPTPMFPSSLNPDTGVVTIPYASIYSNGTLEDTRYSLQLQLVPPGNLLELAQLLEQKPSVKILSGVDGSGARAILENARGDKLVLIGDGSTGEDINDLQAVIYEDASGTTATSFLDEKGLPASLVVNDVVFKFSNYTQNTVDITIVGSDGSSQTLPGLALNAETLRAIREISDGGSSQSVLALRSTLDSTGAGKLETLGISDATYNLMKLAPLAGSIASCAVASAALVGTTVTTGIGGLLTLGLWSASCLNMGMALGDVAYYGISDYGEVTPSDRVSATQCVLTVDFYNCGGLLISGYADTLYEKQQKAERAGATVRVNSEPKRALTIARTGQGQGTVTSSPSGINCGSTCSYSFTDKQSVTLTASALSGSTFSGWSGACSGTSRTCTLSMSQAMSASANFNLRPVSQTLSVTRTGDGSGTVSSSPSGINCGSSCSASFDDGQKVTLTASASSSAVFAGWSGACSGSSATCSVTMTQARSATAEFIKKPSSGGELTTMYEQSFSSNPGFTSLSTANAYWDSSAGNYVVKTMRSDTVKRWAYSPAFSNVDTTSAASINLDIRFENQTYATYPRVAFYPSRPTEISQSNNAPGVLIYNANSDSSMNKIDIRINGADPVLSPVISNNVWYNVDIQFGSNRLATVTIRNKSTNAVILSKSNLSFSPFQFRYLGVGYYQAQQNYNAVESPIRIDNIVIKN